MKGSGVCDVIWWERWWENGKGREDWTRKKSKIKSLIWIWIWIYLRVDSGMDGWMDGCTTRSRHSWSCFSFLCIIFILFMTCALDFGHLNVIMEFGVLAS